MASGVLRSVGDAHDGGPNATTAWWRPLSKSDRWAIALLVGLPLGHLLGAGASFGYPAIAQDNLLQNFPLRVLVGQQILSGHLPLFNRLADSGTPLLGGMNAGAFFPLPGSSSCCPAILSWVLNIIAVYAGAALGLFALLRWHKLGTLRELHRRVRVRVEWRDDRPDGAPRRRPGLRTLAVGDTRHACHGRRDASRE